MIDGSGGVRRFSQCQYGLGGIAEIVRLMRLMHLGKKGTRVPQYVGFVGQKYIVMRIRQGDYERGGDGVFDGTADNLSCAVPARNVP
jgi:hypothetical protein